MAAFGGMTLTNKGLALLGKAQAGTQLTYTRIAVGDGSLSGQSIPALNALISQKKSLTITRVQPQPPNKVAVRATLSNTGITTGFYWREVGLFAQDPDVGEILYAYANAGATADYIPPGGGTDVIEKEFNVIVGVGTASNITVTIDDSLVYVNKADFQDEMDAFAEQAGKIVVSETAPEDPNTNTYWYEDLGQAENLSAGLLIGNGSMTTGGDIWFEEV